MVDMEKIGGGVVSVFTECLAYIPQLLQFLLGIIWKRLTHKLQ